MTESRSTRDPRPGSPMAGRVPLNNDAAPGAPPVRKKKRRTGLVVGILTVLVVLAVVAIVMAKKGATDAVIVETQKVTTRTIRQTVTATGVVDPETQVKISPEVSGEIVYLGVVEGQVVRKGQVLVRINPQSMLAQRDEASAGILAAQARAAQSQASLMRSQQDLGRVRQLFEKKLATNQELDAAEAQVKIGAAEADAAKFQVAQSRASLRQVTESLNKTTIVAPLS
ncbi:MAG: biotin/lipoyl-binding protein, partial [Bacteroidota bacterium]